MCQNARTTLLVEREAIDCQSAPASARCAEFRATLRANARFALRAPADAPWPFGKEIRAQCGGVLGLHAQLGDGDPVDAPGPPDVDRTLENALARFGAIDALPYSEIMRAVVRYEPRPKSGR